MKKLYLETPESVIKALKAGKEVRDASGSICKLVDGIIISKLNDFFEIGKPIRSVNKPYILEEEPLKIEVGKCYETRNHQKARCYNFDNNSYFFTIDNYTVFMTDTKGSFRRKQVISDLDIIGPWKE